MNNQSLLDEISSITSIFEQTTVSDFAKDCTKISCPIQVSVFKLSLDFSINPKTYSVTTSLTNIPNAKHPLPPALLTKIHTQIQTEFDKNPSPESMPIYQTIEYCHLQLPTDKEIISDIKSLPNFTAINEELSAFAFHNQYMAQKTNNDLSSDESDTTDSKETELISNNSFSSSSSSLIITAKERNSSFKQLLADIRAKKVTKLTPVKPEPEFKATDDSKYNLPDPDAYFVNLDHVHIPVVDFADQLGDEKEENNQYDAKKLLDLVNAIDLSKEQLALWANYSGGTLFSNKNCVTSRLRSVVNYAETNKQCPAHVKAKLRMITKLILEQTDDLNVRPLPQKLKNEDKYVHILLLIASHGNVCNVMKDVAIGNAYGLMTDKMEHLVAAQSLEQQIFKNLRDFRVLLVEKVFHAFKMTNNTHYIAGFHNKLAEKIGVVPYHDEHISNNPSSSVCSGWQKGLKERYFGEYYTVDAIVKFVYSQVAEKKIGYQKIVKMLEENCPNEIEKMEWLQMAIDIDSGEIKVEFMYWMLEKLKVFKIKDDTWKPIEKCWDDIKVSK